MGDGTLKGRKGGRSSTILPSSKTKLTATPPPPPRKMRNHTLRGSFSSLSTLCLYSNAIASLPLTMELVSSLPALTDVALEGNECSSKEGYRQR